MWKRREGEEGGGAAGAGTASGPLGSGCAGERICDGEGEDVWSVSDVHGGRVF